jgi:hypothetical protein
MDILMRASEKITGNLKVLKKGRTTSFWRGRKPRSAGAGKDWVFFVDAGAVYARARYAGYVPKKTARNLQGAGAVGWSHQGDGAGDVPGPPVGASEASAAGPVALALCGGECSPDRRQSAIAESMSPDEACGRVHALVAPLPICGDPGEVESQGFSWDAGLWPMVLASNGGAVAAGLAALEHGVAGSLSSGLHHARRAKGAGFCTFNGLALAAREALAGGTRSILRRRVQHEALAPCLTHRAPRRPAT